MRAAGALWLGLWASAALAQAVVPLPPLPGPPGSAAQALEWRAYRAFSSADGLPQNSVLALAQDAEGFLHAGTHHGLARYDGRHWDAVELPTGERSFAVGALHLARDGALWIGTDSVGVWRRAGGVLQPVPLPGASEAVHAFWEAPDGRLWIAASEGLFRCRARECERIDALGPVGARSLLGEIVDERPRLWVGSNGAGVVELLDVDTPRPRRSGLALTRAHGLPNDIGLSLARFAGDLWIGSGRGLARWDGERLHVYGAGNGFPMAMVFALLPSVDAAGAPVLLAALRPGGLAELRADGGWRLVDSREGLPTNAVHSLWRERTRGAIWIGTIGAGVARIEDERWALFDERRGLPDRIVVGVGWSAPTRTLWVGTAGGAVQWHGGRFAPLLPPTHATQLVHDVVDAADGTRWIAHARGLQRWRGERLEFDYEVDGSALPAVSADRLALRRAGDLLELWIATGHGLARWTEADGLQAVGGLPGVLPDSGVRAFATLADAEGEGHDALWLVGDGGLLRLGRDGWRRRDAACLRDQLLSGVAAHRDAGGETLWVSTRSGLRRLAPDDACADYPAARSLGALTHVRVHGDALYVFGARGVLRFARAGDPRQAGRGYGAADGLPSPEIAASAIDDRGRVFGATAAGLAALQPAPRAAVVTPAPLQLLAAQAGAAAAPLTPGALLAADDSSVRFDVRLLAFAHEHATRYRVRLEGLDDDFGPWTAEPTIAYPRLPPGAYRLVVQARDGDGALAEPLVFPFAVAAPWWRHVGVLAAAALALLAAGIGVGRWRSRAARRSAQALEAEVAARTRELAAANAQLGQAAVTDPLTGLKNRRYFALAAEAEAERARRAPAAQTLLVALLDVDHFKRINDAHGHATGDDVLVEVARRLQRVARGGDLVLRWGGEEFLLLLRDVARDSADALLQRLLGELAATPYDVDGVQLRCTASIGAVCFPTAAPLPPTATLEQAIALADGALYRAKRGGRDRAVRVGIGHGVTLLRTDVSTSA